MALVRPFRAVRPLAELAEQIACLPYDVMNRAEAKAMAGDNKPRLPRVVRAEIDPPAPVDDYDDAVLREGLRPAQ